MSGNGYGSRDSRTGAAHLDHRVLTLRKVQDLWQVGPRLRRGRWRARLQNSQMIDDEARRRRARRDKLTALLHHLTVDVLRASFFGLKKFVLCSSAVSLALVSRI